MKTFLLTVFMFLCTFFICFNYSFCNQLFNESNCTKIEIFDDFKNCIVPQTYEKRFKPPLINGSLPINVILHVYKLEKSPELIDITVRFAMYQFWNDSRLKIPKFVNRSIYLPKELTEVIWLPETILYLVPAEEPRQNELKFFNSGQIRYLKHITTLAICTRDFTFFPVDQKNCTLYMGNFADHSILYKWWWKDKERFTFTDNLFLPNLRLLGFNLRANRHFWNSSSLWVDIFISRNVLFFLARFYLPALIVVIIAFLPLYLTPNGHSKVALGVAGMLTMVTLITNSSSDLPKIGSLTALDVYMFFCFFSVFLAVVEYSLVGYYELVLKKAEDSGKSVVNETALEEVTPKKEEIKVALKRSWTVDFISRRLYPVIFCLFNLVYAAVMISVYVKNKQVEIQYPFLDKTTVW